MEVLKPQLIWIGNRCYRKNPLKDNQGYNPEDEELDDGAPYTDLTYCDEACDADLEIEETDKGFRTVMSVPNAYYKYVIGKKGETKKRLESETRTQILVPKPGEKREEIVILGHDKKGIVSAKTRLDVIIDSARQRQQFTHFLSIPVTCEQVVTGFEDFRFEVLRQCDGDRGLDASLFQNPKKLHLTIGTMVLLNDNEIERAAVHLQSCQEELIQPLLQGERLEVQIRGLEYMNDDPGSVDVLYARVQEGCACDRLQSLVDRLVDRLTSAGIMQRDHERVKLHVTVMNTLMRKDPSGTSVPQADSNGHARPRERESFDASQILKKFPDFDFGPLHIDSLHLSQRYSTGDNGYYAQVTAVELPR
ncbi:activating signal cointegrator 1 complex subunit 1 [Aplysia californica]|uniref:Activating signal cointegrator 1 complex subunit 1 n=1 Tax=Aplysia californica TaxID=6500 RepID=A0ABM1VUL0_APLCA|nr:activating signal cointegrator 1 complex subunit 1 [Aplysia californica]XP_035826102.1 activating signal cointegrator 1 complex subunit 1 [Aplysia californica]